MRLKIMIIVLMLSVLACSTQAAIVPPNREYRTSLLTDDFYLRHVSRHILQIDTGRPR